MESLKTFLSDSKGYLQRIVGLADWRSEPSMSLEQVTTQTRAILGNMDQFAVPDIHLANASSQIAAIIGESDSLATPDITLAEASSQIAAIIGENDDAATPNITLANTKLHVDTTPATGTVHGITGWSVAPVALGSAFAGVATTIARSDHVHPTTGLLTTDSALTTAQLGGTPVALGAINSAGLSTTAAKSDHQHIYPTAPQVGAMATSHAANAITGFGTSSVALNDSGLNGSSTLVARSDHVHPRTGLMTDLHPANDIAGFALTASALAASQDPGSSTTVSRGNHQHPLPSLTTLGAAAKAGSATQAFAASTLTADKVVTDVGTAGGMKGNGVSAIFGFGTSGSVAAVFCDAGLYVKNYANSGPYTPVAASAFNIGSDERLKRGIRPLRAGDGLTALSALAKNGVIHYKLKEDADDAPDRLGFSAQQVAAARPEAACILESVAGEDPLLGWEIGAMMAMVVDAVGALADRLEALEKGRGRS